jgi:ankyrin repeat protein
VLKARADLQNKKGKSLLMIASYYGHVNILKTLLANPNLQNKLGWTSLMTASVWGCNRIIN